MTTPRQSSDCDHLGVPYGLFRRSKPLHNVCIHRGGSTLRKYMSFSRSPDHLHGSVADWASACVRPMRPEPQAALDAALRIRRDIDRGQAPSLEDESIVRAYVADTNMPIADLAADVILKIVADKLGLDID